MITTWQILDFSSTAYQAQISRVNNVADYVGLQANLQKIAQDRALKIKPAKILQQGGSYAPAGLQGKPYRNGTLRNRRPEWSRLCKTLTVLIAFGPQRHTSWADDCYTNFQWKAAFARSQSMTFMKMLKCQFFQDFLACTSSSRKISVVSKRILASFGNAGGYCSHTW